MEVIQVHDTVGQIGDQRFESPAAATFDMDGIQDRSGILSGQVTHLLHEPGKSLRGRLVALARITITIYWIGDIKIGRYQEAISGRLTGEDHLAIGTRTDDHRIPAGVSELHLIVHVGMPLVGIDPGNYFFHRGAFVHDSNGITCIIAWDRFTLWMRIDIHPG